MAYTSADREQGCGEAKLDPSPKTSMVPAPMSDSTVQNHSEQVTLSSNRFVRALWFSAGMLCLGLGLVGVIVPGLPTTPFMILAAACFAHSSERFYNWILNHRTFGKLVRRFRAGKGIPLKIKVLGASVSTVFVSFAVLYAMPQHLLIPRISTAIAGVIGVWYILSRPTDHGD